MINWVDVYLEIYFLLNFCKPRWYENLSILIFFEETIYFLGLEVLHLWMTSF